MTAAALERELVALRSAVKREVERDVIEGSSTRAEPRSFRLRAVDR